MLGLLENMDLRKGFSSADDIARGMWELLTRGETIPLRVPLGKSSWEVVASEVENRKRELEGLREFSSSFGGDLSAGSAATLKDLM